MPNFNKLLTKVDKFQQKHAITAFSVAVIKKYGDDEAGKLGALITYYGFLSLFPLLMVTSTILQIVFRHHEEFRTTVINSINHYFPVLNDYFAGDVRGLQKTGLALVVGLLLTLYGALGGASMARNAINKIWHVPKDKWPRYPKSVLVNLQLVVVGGGALVVAAILSSHSASISFGLASRLIPLAISLICLVFAFFLIFKICIATQEHAAKYIFTSAFIAAVGIQALLILGGYLVTHELKNLSKLYGTFAVVLGLMFW